MIKKFKQLFESGDDKITRISIPDSAEIAERYEWFSLQNLKEDYSVNESYYVYEINNYKFIIIKIFGDLELLIFDKDDYVISIETKMKTVLECFTALSMDENEFNNYIEEYKTIINTLKLYNGKTISEVKNTKEYKDYIKNKNVKKFKV